MEGGDRPGLGAAAPAGPAPVQLCRFQSGAVGQRDRVAEAAESPAGRRLLPPRNCGGASRAGPASGVKATATALRARRLYVP
ncbi:Protein Gvqw3 [Manis pentadactyla]|nr:Protein Gvqw3 [Manis pentadactyla]